MGHSIADRPYGGLISSEARPGALGNRTHEYEPRGRPGQFADRSAPQTIGLVTTQASRRRHGLAWPWYVTGASDARFDDDVLHELDVITGRNLEVVNTTGLVNGP